jgi:hypothetical protein
MHSQAEIEKLLKRLNNADGITRVKILHRLLNMGPVVVSPTIDFAEDESVSTSVRFWAIQALGDVDARAETEAKIQKSLRKLIASPVAELRAAAAAAALERYGRGAIHWVEPLLDDKTELPEFWWSEDVSGYVTQLLSEVV